jgi:hypothetical protein
MNKYRYRTSVCLSLRMPIWAAMLLILCGCGRAPEVASVDQAGAVNDSSPVVDKKTSADEPVAQSVQPAKPELKAEPLPKTEPEPKAEPVPEAEPVPKAEPPKVPVDVPAFLDDALNGKLEAVRQALKAGVDVNVADEQRRTALLFASFNGHTAVAQLLDQGATLNQRDAVGRTALMFAATGANAETVELLLEAGAEVNAVDADEKFTALMHAAAEGQVKVVGVLLKHNADSAIRDTDGDTAQDFAARNGHAEVVRLLSK